VAVLIRKQIKVVIAAGGAVLAGSAALGLLQPGDASSAVVPAPTVAPLSVSIDDERTGAAGGERLTYTIRVRNNGSDAVSAARISQRLPAALSPVAASSGGVVSRSEASWTVAVPARGEVAVRLTALVGSSRNSYPRLVTTGCVAASAAVPPAVCGSDVNALRLPPRSHMGSWLLLFFLLSLAAIGAGLWRWLTHTPGTKQRRRSRSRVSAASAPAGWKPRRLVPVAVYASAEAVDDLAGVFVPSAVRAAVGRLPDHGPGHARSPPYTRRRYERPSAGVDVLRTVARLRIRSARSAASPLAGRRHCRYG
jgi:uncharacterized repeat protein (TIGR01451 family)